MINALIVDDEAPARSRIVRFLDESPSIHIIGEAQDGRAALDQIKAAQPDLLFLDIQMPIMNGFELLRHLKSPPAVVFVSAYDEYVLKAFEVNAMDYLLKPFTRERFATTLKRVLSEIDDRQLWEERIRNVISSYSRTDNYLTRISIRRNHVFNIIETHNIDFFRTDGGLVYLWTEGRKYQIDFTLSQLEKRLDPTCFIRVHRNALVRIDRILRIVPWGQGRLALEYGSSGTVQVSRDNISPLRRILGMK